MLRSTIYHISWILYNYRSASTSPNCTPLWFLIGLFVSTLFFYVLLTIHNKILRISICAACTAVCYVLKFFNFPYLPWHMDTALVGMTFMYIGYSLRQRDLVNCEKTNLYLLPLLVIIGSVSILNNSRIDLNVLKINNTVLMYVGAVSISFIFLWLFKNKLNSQNKLLEYLGKNTIVIMAFNYAINTYSRIIFNRISIFRGINYTWWMLSLVDVLFSLILIYLWNTVKNRFPKVAIF